MEPLSPLQSILYGMIQTFCERQAIVLEAMRELRPDQVMRAFGTGTPQEQTALRLKYMRNAPVGLWGQNPEWEYFLHGNGCRLTNTETLEKLQWDIQDGNLRRFARSWFVDYLEWRIAVDQRHADHVLVKNWLAQQKEALTDPQLPHDMTEMFIFAVLDELVTLGLLIHEGHQYYLLVDSIS